MKILPPTTEPPPEPTRRRHEPAAGRYQTYRACLRWDFGFTCPFCLLHEADVVLHGAEGFGVFQIEHREPQHSEAGRELVDRYENVLYICVLCNRSRWDRPVQDAQGRRLLDPTITAWREHFDARDGSLSPRAPDDVDAKYTWEAYDLDDARKVERRRFRHAVITDRLRLLREGPGRRARLEAIAARAQDAADARALLQEARAVTEDMRRAARDLQIFAAVPRDTHPRCRCGHDRHHHLPAGLEAQVIELPPANL